MGRRYLHNIRLSSSAWEVLRASTASCLLSSFTFSSCSVVFGECTTKLPPGSRERRASELILHARTYVRVAKNWWPSRCSKPAWFFYSFSFFSDKLFRQCKMLQPFWQPWCWETEEAYVSGLDLVWHQELHTGATFWQPWLKGTEGAN